MTDDAMYQTLANSVSRYMTSKYSADPILALMRYRTVCATWSQIFNVHLLVDAISRGYYMNSPEMQDRKNTVCDVCVTIYI